MCQQCDYKRILETSGLEATANRLHVLEIIGGTTSPLSADDILKIVEQTRHINRVTVYRILDLLVEKNIVERLNLGGRAARYGMAPNEHHAPHPHFFCTRCGALDCLQPESMKIDINRLQQNSNGRIGRVEVRVDGICNDCLQQES